MDIAIRDHFLSKKHSVLFNSPFHLHRLESIYDAVPISRGDVNRTSYFRESFSSIPVLGFRVARPSFYDAL